MNFKEISPYNLSLNPFTLVGKQWMIVNAAAGGKSNGMTASWGGMGILWGKPVCFVFIRPERYTHDFIERDGKITLSFFDEDFRAALNVFGSKSGRDTDKTAAAGLTEQTDGDFVFYEQAKLVIECEKIYKDNLKENCFFDKSLLSSYANGGYHDMYICEIKKVFVK